MNTVFENSPEKGLSQVSCTKYKNLNNLSHYHSDYERIHVNEGSAQNAANEHLFKIFKIRADESALALRHKIHPESARA